MSSMSSMSSIHNIDSNNYIDTNSENDSDRVEYVLGIRHTTLDSTLTSTLNFAHSCCPCPCQTRLVLVLVLSIPVPIFILRFISNLLKLSYFQGLHTNYMLTIMTITFAFYIAIFTKQKPGNVYELLSTT